ncbi:hypothetical protein F5887DRAFT_213210 [Amanita rubescens]|nr:hypothetical protein F5887DRAFT_213210 [Amanita rubescens]
MMMMTPRNLKNHSTSPFTCQNRSSTCGLENYKGPGPENSIEDDDIPLSRSTTGIAYPHGGRGGIPIDVDPEDTHDLHYLADSTMRSDVPGRSLSMKKSPISFTGGEYVSHNEAYPRDPDSNYIEPVIFEHEVIRNDGQPNPKIWHYIVPGGLDVIFKDEDGNELTRIRNMGDKSTKRRIIPMVIEDEHGKVIYRCDNVLIPPHDL